MRRGCGGGAGSSGFLRDNQPRCFGLQAHQFLNGRRGACFGPLFQPFAQQDKSDDHARCLEIHVRMNAPALEIMRIYGVEQTENKRDKRAHRYQRVHIGTAVFQQFPPPHIKTAAAVKKQRQGKDQHTPSGPGLFHETH